MRQALQPSLRRSIGLSDFAVKAPDDKEGRQVRLSTFFPFESQPFRSETAAYFARNSLLFLFLAFTENKLLRQLWQQAIYSGMQLCPNAFMPECIYARMQS